MKFKFLSSQTSLLRLNTNSFSSQTSPFLLSLFSVYSNKPEGDSSGKNDLDLKSFAYCTKNGQFLYPDGF